MAGQDPTYRLVHLGHVKVQILEIATRARQIGLYPQKATLSTIVEKLLHEPEEWGDPLYKAAKPGGIICRGMLAPIITHYTLFKEEKLVLVWDIRATNSFGSP